MGISSAEIEARMEEIRRMIREAEGPEVLERAEQALLLEEISACCRWLAVRAPRLYRQLPTEITDEPGHWDSSFPPKEHVAGVTEDRYILIRDPQTTQRPLEGGAYYTFEVKTTTPGLAVSRDGHLVSIEESGTARVGSYAAHPGVCGRDIMRDYLPIGEPVGEPTLEELREAAEVLRRLVREREQATAAVS